jgi:hypothetical protein
MDWKKYPWFREGGLQGILDVCDEAAGKFAVIALRADGWFKFKLVYDDHVADSFAAAAHHTNTLMECWILKNESVQYGSPKAPGFLSAWSKALQDPPKPILPSLR